MRTLSATRGALVTEDALRSLVISHYLLGTQEFMIINHTDCGMLTFKDEDLVARLKKETGMVRPWDRRSFIRLAAWKKCPRTDPESAIAPVDSQDHSGSGVHLRCQDGEVE